MLKEKLVLCKDLPYEKTFELLKAYGWIGRNKQRIIEFFFKLDYFEGSYSELTKSLGYSTGERRISKKSGKEYWNNGDISNIAKEVKILNRLGLIYIGYHESDYIDDEGTVRKGAKPKVMFLVDGWMQNLIDSYHKYSEKIPNLSIDYYKEIKEIE